jgi:hypothetical protein
MADERPDDRGRDEPTPDAAADEAAWQQLVASLKQGAPEGETPWPEQENLSSRPDDAPRDPPAPEPAVAPPVIIWRGSEADIDAEIDRAIPDEHFVPPEPPPLPRTDALTAAAWFGAVGSPLMLLLVVALGWTPAWLMVGLTVAFVGGFALLLSRLRTQRDPYDPDNGAVV